MSPAVPTRRVARLTSVLASLAMLLGLSLVAAPAASAASPVIDGFVTVRSVVVNSNRTITVKLDVKKTIPSQAPVGISWRYASATRNNAQYSRQSISGAPGPRTITLTGVPAHAMVVRVVLSFARPSETRTYHRLVSPGTRTTATTVTAAHAAANAVAQHIPGAILTFAPQGRAVRFAGALILGWSVFSDVKQAVTGTTTSCPRLAAGQYIRTTTWLSSDGTKAKYHVRNVVYRSYSDYANGRAPLCNVSYVSATWT